jgi:hypothetical protein
VARYRSETYRTAWRSPADPAEPERLTSPGGLDRCWGGTTARSVRI